MTRPSIGRRSKNLALVCREASAKPFLSMGKERDIVPPDADPGCAERSIPSHESPAWLRWKVNAVTPAQYASAFRKLRVYLDSELGDDDPQPTPMALNEQGRTPPSLSFRPRQEIVDVKSYLLVSGGGAPSKPYYWKLGPALKNALYIEATIFRIDGTIETNSFQYDQIAYGLIAPFWGKGYPEECQLALQLWHRLGLGPPAVKDMVLENGSIGLDCNGFVGAYLERSRNPSQWLRTRGTMTGSPINELLRLNGAFLNSMADFAPPEGRSMLSVRSESC